MSSNDDDTLNMTGSVPSGESAAVGATPRASGAADERLESEHVEPYLHLQHYLEQLRSDQRPSPPERFSADETGVYPMAAFLRSAAPGAATPNPAFVAALQQRLLGALQDPASNDLAVAVGPAAENSTPASAPLVPLVPVAPTPAVPPRARSGVSRRGLLGAGLGAAAAAVVGAAVGAGADHALTTSDQHVPPEVALVPQGRGAWVAVAPVTAIPLGAVHRFTTEAIVGFIRHTAGGFSALSGVCTHMSCFLSWNQTVRTFDCPCHGGRFTEEGTFAADSPVIYRPLPHIETQVRDGQVWVYVVAAAGSGATSTDVPETNPYTR